MFFADQVSTQESAGQTLGFHRNLRSSPHFSPISASSERTAEVPAFLTHFSITSQIMADVPAPGERWVDPGWGVLRPTAADKEIPDVINDMPVSSDLRKQYQGASELLYFRAVHSPACRKPFDALVLCVRQLLDADTCTDVIRAYKPCSEEIHRKRVAAMQQVCVGQREGQPLARAAQ